MDLLSFSPPEIFLNDRADPDYTQSGSFPFSDDHQLLPASHEEHWSPAEPQTVTDRSAGMLQISPDPGADIVQDCSCSLNVSQDSCCSSTNSSFGPFVLVPLSSPCSPPGSWLLVPEPRPSWCSCPQPCSPDLAVSRRTAGQVSEQFTPGREQTEGQAGSEALSFLLEAEEDKNNREDGRTKCEFSPGSVLYLESLADRSFEGYKMMMDSLSPKGVAGRETEEKLQQNVSFLEYLDGMCRDGNFVREVESLLDKDFLDFLLSSEAELPDLLALEKQQQETLEQQPHVSSAASSSEEPSLLPPRVNEETAALRQAQLQSDTQTEHEAARRNPGPQQGWTPCSPLLPSALLEEEEDSRPGSPFTDFITSSVQLLAPHTTSSSDTQSDQMSRNLQEGPLESSEDLWEDHVARADFSPTQSGGPPALSVLALRRLYRPLPLIRKPEEQHGPKNTNPVPADWSSMEDLETVLQTGLQASESSELRAAERGESVAATQKQTEEKEKKTKRTTNTGHSQRLSGHTEKEKARLSGAFTTEREKSVKKTPIFTPEREKQRRRPFSGRRLFTTEEFSQTAEEGSCQKPAGEMQKVEVEGQSEPSVSEETGAENGPLTNMPQEENRKEEVIQVSGDVNHLNLAGCSTSEVKVSQPECSLQNLKVQIENHSTQNPNVTRPDAQEQSRTAALSGNRQTEASYVNVSSETGAENAALIKVAQEQKELGGIQMSSCVSRRRTRSMTATEEKVQLTMREMQEEDKLNVKEDVNEKQLVSSPLKRRKNKDEETKREKDNNMNVSVSPSEEKGSKTCVRNLNLTRPEAQKQSKTAFGAENVSKRTGIEEREGAEDAAQEMMGLSPMKRSRNRGGEEEKKKEANDEKKTNLAGCNTSDIKVSQTDTHSTENSEKESEKESPSVKICEKNPHLTFPDDQQHSKTAALSGGEVTGNKSLDFYSLRSQNVPKRTVNKRIQEMTQLSNIELPADVKDEEEIKGEEERQRVALSPMKRCRHERETRGKETDVISLSPVKRGRSTSRVEGNDESGGKDIQNKACSQKFPRKKPQRSRKLQTKYKDFVGCRRQLRSAMKTRSTASVK